MEDFYYAGGLRALMSEIPDLLDLDCLTVNGKTLGENLEGARHLPEVIRGASAAYGKAAPPSCTAISRPRRGDQDRRGRPAPAEAQRPAVVFHDYDDMAAR